jgi:glutamate-5-semialdehyde dehydrogenase
VDIREKSMHAKKASKLMAAVKSDAKNQALKNIADALKKYMPDLIEANRIDLERSEKQKLSSPLLKRLKFDGSKIEEACDGLNSLIGMKDPVGVTLRAVELDDGLELYKVSCPIGVIGVIFESRPDALVQISALCLKSGNAVLLKGGSEASATNRLLAEIITRASIEAKIPQGWLALLETRTDVEDMLAMDQFIDLIVPRGSNAFVRHIIENTNIPVLGHADGICHVYIDRVADVDMAVKISVDSKCQYAAVCNAAETILVHRDIAGRYLPEMKKALETKNVEIRGCPETLKIIDVIEATEKDWTTEYLDLIISVKIVDTLEEAISHINTYGSGHTDVIVTGDRERASKFMDLVDSADVFLNCSSRFSDGFRFGLGAEVGISTNKIHARGPVGLEGLLIYKWKLFGNGHIVADYSGAKAKSFTHRPL